MCVEHSGKQYTIVYYTGFAHRVYILGYSPKSRINSCKNKHILICTNGVIPVVTKNGTLNYFPVLSIKFMISDLGYLHVYRGF